ncbi:hypothetical protein D5086_023260, partial [Populus alba]
FALHDDSNEVRRRGLFALKAVAKASPPSITVHVSIIGLALVKCLRDSSTPVQTMFKLLKNLLQAWMLGDFQSSLNIGSVCLVSWISSSNPHLASCIIPITTHNIKDA